MDYSTGQDTGSTYWDDPFTDPNADPLNPQYGTQQPKVNVEDPTYPDEPAAPAPNAPAPSAPAPTTPPPDPYGGGLTPNSPYVDNAHPRTYTGADGNVYQDDMDPNSVSGFTQKPKMSALDFLKQWKSQHKANEGLQPLLDAFKTGGYTDVNPFMYGQQQSHNEISLNGQKFKVIGGEDSANPFWYEPGMDDNPGHPTTGGHPNGMGGAGWNAAGGSPVDFASLFQHAFGQGGTAGNDDLHKALMGLIDRGNGMLDSYSKPVGPNDPFIQPIVDAYHGRTARAVASNRERMAERAHAEGVPTGAFDSAINNSEMSAGRDEGSLESQLMSDENNRRRGFLSDTFGKEAGAIGQGQQSNNSMMGILGNLLNSQQGLNQQNNQYYDNLSWLMSSHANDLDAELARTLFGG